MPVSELTLESKQLSTQSVEFTFAFWKTKFSKFVCDWETWNWSNFDAYLFADPKKQLFLSIKAVFDSWDSPRANKYRSINQITGLKGTAVNIQTMVFGNMGNTSGTGVLFTRNPSTGEKKLYGEFLVNAQVVNMYKIFYLCRTSFLTIFV